MGKLYICGTPIGNLEDVSIRLLKTLRSVDLIICEDTRHTFKLLSRYKIKKATISYHEHSKKSKEDYIIEELSKGKNIALVSDAGMPLISDPGYNLIMRIIEAGIAIEVVPGPSAFVAALALSGIDSKNFVFEGFLPRRRGKRLEKLSELKDETRTLAIYEAPHRLLDTLADIERVMGGERNLAVTRELTKKHEEVKRGSVAEIRKYFINNQPRGEITIVIAGKEELIDNESKLDEIAEEIEEMINEGIDKKEAFKMKAREYKVKKSLIYNYFVGKNKQE